MGIIYSIPNSYQEAALDESMASQLRLIGKLPNITYYASIGITIFGILLSRLMVFLYRKEGYKILVESSSLSPTI